MSRTKYKNVKIFNCNCIDDDDDHDTDEYKDDNDINIVVYVKRLFYDIVQMVLTKKSPERN
jgi:hypothetical protein